MDAELSRIKSDVETMRSAVGLGDPPFGRADVTSLILLGISGMALAAWVIVMGSLRGQSLTMLALAACVAAVVQYQLAHTRAAARTISRDRGNRWSWGMSALLGLLIGGFYLWAHFGMKMSNTTFLGSAAFLTGALMIILAVTDSWRLYFLGLAIPMIGFACLVPFLSPGTYQIAIGAMASVGGFASAIILSWQLRTAK